ncbi:hypothetical protein [Ensifer adhaerens]|nr:hypothetical protein [Ensifer adhaerens]
MAQPFAAVVTAPMRFGATEFRAEALLAAHEQTSRTQRFKPALGQTST